MSPAGQPIDDATLTNLRRALEANPTDLQLAREYWNALGRWRGTDIRSGRDVIEAFRAAALASRQGVVALAEAYYSLWRVSGEGPRKGYVDAQLVAEIKKALAALDADQRSVVEWFISFLSMDEAQPEG